MTRQRLQDEMLQIARAAKATIFFVSRELEEAICLGDRVISPMPHPGRIGIELVVIRCLRMRRSVGGEHAGRCRAAR